MEGEGNLDGVTLLTETASSDHRRNVTTGDSSVITPMLVFSTLVVVCCPFASRCALGYSSPTESAIMENLGLFNAAYSLFGLLLTMGGIIASLVYGKVTDVIGRKCTMWLCDACFLIGYLSVAFVENAWWLDFGRLFTGFGVGNASYVLILSSGFSFMYFLDTTVSWHTLAIIGGLPCVLKLIGLFFIPESPRWLAIVGREKEFEVALQTLRGTDADV